jgi:methanogenic corrinoid protein MtbC1
VPAAERLQQRLRCAVDGDEGATCSACRVAIQQGLDPQVILREGLLKGAATVGQRFEDDENFLKELMFAGRALKSALAVLRPMLAARYGSQGQCEGRVVLATIQTDIHDIGECLVGCMLSAAGFEVIDLSVDVPVREIVVQAQKHHANIIGLSALLATSMPYMRDVLDLLGARGKPWPGL